MNKRESWSVAIICYVPSFICGNILARKRERSMCSIRLIILVSIPDIPDTSANNRHIDFTGIPSKASTGNSELPKKLVMQSATENARSVAGTSTGCRCNSWLRHGVWEYCCTLWPLWGRWIIVCSLLLNIILLTQFSTSSYSALSRVHLL